MILFPLFMSTFTLFCLSLLAISLISELPVNYTLDLIAEQYNSTFLYLSHQLAIIEENKEI